MNKEEMITRLMQKTGKSRLACDIALSLVGGDFQKAIERMKISYPSMEVQNE